MNALSLEDFETLEFTPQQKLEDRDGGFVYVLLLQTTLKDIPFYVGRSKSFYRRMDDYFWKDFSAGTDFKVGTAIDYLVNQEKAKVIVRYKYVQNATSVENDMIAQANELGLELLNGRVCIAHDAIEVAEHKIVARCQAILRSHAVEAR